MGEIVKLTKEYIKVKRRDGRITCGGDQNFFAGAPEGSADWRKQKLGCGITALGDLFLYLEDRDKERLPEEMQTATVSGGKSHRPQSRTAGTQETEPPFSEREYRDYYNRIYRFAGRIPPWAKNGLSVARIQLTFNRMARRRGWRLRARWGMSYRKLPGRIAEMLGRDIPVIWCIPFMAFKRDKKKGVSFYEKRDGAYRKACTVSAHYVVVLGIAQEKAGTWLEISSWGNIYYVNWEEYCALIHPPLHGQPVYGLCSRFLETILGNILYIR